MQGSSALFQQYDEDGDPVGNAYAAARENIATSISSDRMMISFKNTEDNTAIFGNGVPTDELITDNSTTALYPDVDAFIANSAFFLFEGGGTGSGLPSMVGNAGKVLSTNGTSASWEAISARFNIVDYGAVAAAPGEDPDDVPDSTPAIRAALNAILATPTKSGTIWVPKGVFYLQSAPLTDGYGRRGQIMVPLFTEAVGTNGIYPCIRIEGEEFPATEVQALIETVPPLNGSMLISNYLAPGGQHFSVINVAANSDATTFEKVNWVRVDVHNLGVGTRTHDINGNPARISSDAVDLDWAAQSINGDVRTFTSVAPINSLNPMLGGVETVGFRMPRGSNHATCTINYLLTNGFSFGSWLGEHTIANRIIAVGNDTGLLTSGEYPIQVNSYCTEANRYNHRCTNAANVSFGMIEGENFKPSTLPQFANANDLDSYGGGFLYANVTVLQRFVNFDGYSGGGRAPFVKGSALIKAAIINNNGLYGVEADTWDNGTRPSAPINGMSGYNTDSLRMEYYVGSEWRTILTEGLPSPASTYLNMTGGSGQSDVANVTAIEQLTQDFEISFDAKIAPGNALSYVFGAIGTSPAADNWVIVYRSDINALVLWDNNGSYLGQAASVPDTAFHNYKWRRTGGVTTAYLDNVAGNTNATAFLTTAKTAPRFIISARPGHPNNWVGGLKNVLVKINSVTVLDLPLADDGEDNGPNGIDVTLSGSYSFV